MRPAKVLRVARWEVSRTTGALDRRSLGLALVVLVGFAALAPFLVGGGLYDDLYTVGVEEDSELRDAIDESDRLRAVEPVWGGIASGEHDIVVRDGTVSVVDTQKGDAALVELREAARRYNAETVGDVSSEAAFPVSVDIEYVDRGITEGVLEDRVETDGDDTDEATVETEDLDEDAPQTEDDTGFSFDLGIGGFLADDGRVGTPSDLTPPFPYESLILAFVFLVPLNFVVQAYSTSIMNERVARRGALMLVAPVTRGEIIVGKTLPYFVAAVVVTAALAAVVGGGVASVAAVAPVALAFLALGFVGAMFARSYKELTFVTVFVSVVVTCYVFVPAIFTEVDPIASISPLSVVVLDLQGEAVGASRYLFSTVPLYLSAAVLFVLGAGVYREEDMFAQRALRHKALDSVAALLHRRASVAKVVVLLIPFVFAAQLLALATLFALPVELSLPLLLLVVSVVEEVAKSIAVYAGFAHRIYERTVRNAVVLGAVSGAAFFVGEKVALGAQVVGLDRLELGRAVVGAGFDVSPLVAVGLLAAPLVLHVTTACISAVGARYGRRDYLVALTAAVTLHTAYNLTVVTLVA